MIRARIRAWPSRTDATSPTTRPRRMTTARSATSLTWSIAWEMTITAWPGVTQAYDEVEHAPALADPERRGRLVEDHRRAS